MSSNSTAKSANYAQLSVTELVVLSQRKDDAALTELLKRHNVYIKNRLYKIAPDWNDHSDLIQEIHIRVWRFIGQLRQPSSFRTWLSQLITNVFYGELRKRPRDFQVVSLDEPFSNDSAEETTRDIPDESQQPEDVLLAKELTQVIGEAMAEVPLQFKTAQILRDVNGMSYQEIAQLTNSELGTVKSRIARARLRIQERVSSYLQDAA
jgi:RNA polymerase sigma-70 factor (ECF subfamily)